VRRGARLRVATKYMQTAREHFAAKACMSISSSSTARWSFAPLLGLADAIGPTLVATGNTLRANRLQAVEEIRPISARLIVNQAALKLKRDAIQPFSTHFSKVVGNMPEIARLSTREPDSIRVSRR